MKILFRTCLLMTILLGIPLHAITLTIETASTPAQTAWGLMGRTTLPPNHGMLFTFSYPHHIGVWMFNCHMDLSVAFLHENHTILEIRELKSYPDVMDPLRPVRSLDDMALYPPNDPVRQFFEEKTIFSYYPAKYMLEVAKGWFEENSVKPGDIILWNTNSSFASVISKGPFDD